MERINDQFKGMPPVTDTRTRSGATVTEEATKKEREKYLGEEIVHYGIVAFMLLTGWWLAVVTSSDNLSMIGQLFGFTVTTWLIIVIYHGLKKGKYIGHQRKAARLAYQLLLVDEGITILAKYYEPFRPYYLMWIAVSIPILAYTAFHLIMLDEGMELSITKAENQVRQRIQQELRTSTQKLLEIDKEIALVQAARNVHNIHRAALLSESVNRATRKDATKSARNVFSEVYTVAGLKDGTGERKRLGVGGKGKRRPSWLGRLHPANWFEAESDGAARIKPEALAVKPSGDGASF